MSDHIKVLDTDIYIGHIESLTNTPTQSDLDYIADIKSPRRRNEIIATRQLLRDILGPKATIGHNPDGSPFLPDHDLNISISHCDRFVAIALNRKGKIGIDIETWRDSLNLVKEKFLTSGEIAIYNTLELLLQAWTAKEAIYKTAGITGLPLHSIILPDNPSHPQATVAINNKTTHYTINTIPHNDFTLTIAKE